MNPSQPRSKRPAPAKRAADTAPVPTYRHHRGSGQAVVTLNGKDHYLGRHGTADSRRKYNRLLARWLAADRALPEPKPHATVADVFDRYRRHAADVYRKPDGTATSTLTCVRHVLHRVGELYGDVAAEDFGPLDLQICLDAMVRDGLAQSTCNDYLKIVMRAFRYAVAQQLVPPSVIQVLQAAEAMRRGRTKARPPRRVRPVPDEAIDAIEPFVSRQVWALIRLQLLTGARGGELLGLRVADFEMGADVWTVKLEDHKTAHHGRERVLYFGPSAQAVLQPFLTDRRLDAPLFSPAEAEEERRRERHARRVTPAGYGNAPGVGRVAEPRRRAGRVYTTDSYRRAIARGCDHAFPPPAPLAQQDEESYAAWMARLTPQQRDELSHWQKQHRWHPHQLRHNAATFLRREFGIEAARVILGHSSPAVTELYAEQDREKALDIISRVG